jgi:hypothetical protein
MLGIVIKPFVLREAFGIEGFFPFFVMKPRAPYMPFDGLHIRFYSNNHTREKGVYADGLWYKLWFGQCSWSCDGIKSFFFGKNKGRGLSSATLTGKEQP